MNPPLKAVPDLLQAVKGCSQGWLPFARGHPKLLEAGGEDLAVEFGQGDFARLDVDVEVIKKADDLRVDHVERTERPKELALMLHEDLAQRVDLRLQRLHAPKGLGQGHGTLPQLFAQDG